MAHWRAISTDARRQIAETWLAAFGAAMTQHDSARAASMMHGAGYWRDLLAFGWDFKTLRGPEAVEAWLTKSFETGGISAVHLDGEPAAGAIGDHSETLEFFFTFETHIANGRGFVRLVPDPRVADGASIFTMLTTAMELKDYPEAVGRKRRREDSQAGKRAVPHDFNASDPEVVIVGGGQSGLMLAARLRQLDVSTLVIEKTGRIGDVWRNRYRTLKLHNEICMNHFAYMPYPDTWPVYLPKDKVADWMEFYAESMDLNVWTGTAFLGGTFDEDANRWTVRLRAADGTTRVMRPSHVILAVGVSGIASVPQIAGADEFAGQIIHSSGNTDSLDAAGKSVVVVGAGTSGHDIAQDMVGRGADVTMVQRSPITVVSLEPSSVRAYELYRANDGVRPLADTDMKAASVPYELLAQLHKPLNRQMAEDDKELLGGLRRAGFLIENGDDDPGYFLKLLKSQSGYYLNVGASDLIISGKIKIKAGVGVERLAKKAVIFSDGSAVPANIVVLATGYEPLQEAARAMLGDDVADRVGPIWGIGADGELRNMYGRTAQQGLHVLGGGFPAARVYSRFTAILIKATLEGLLPLARLLNERLLPSRQNRSWIMPDPSTLTARPLPAFRRVVTTHDANGSATVLIDGDATNHKFPSEHITSTLMWSTDATPTRILGDEDEGARILGSTPPLGGSRFTMMQFFPGNRVDGLHRTDTVDYVICISGEIDMMLDDERCVTLRAGDVVIQRGTYHAWINRSDEPCQLAVILIDALPKREGSISGLLSAR